ncbi:protein bunched, class 1/class 3/D/E isoforms-like [Patiria miniata]|uniref:Uncharacterized protein n=1 Tax=Patiria miniata TaxID=46514 RepID=A0A913ZFP6_PATMI|nr:protein bunched, class 1/class 3/D/E isoforms-like [Patiria miniata]
MDLVKSHLLFAVREEVEVLKEQIKELLEKNEQLQRENNVLRQKQSQGLPTHLPFNQSEAAQPNLQHVGGPSASQDKGGFQSIPGPAAPRVDGYQQQPGTGEQFASMPAGAGPQHGQAPGQQQQVLPQQQASQYGHLQQQAQPKQQQQHTQQTSNQVNQTPSQT